MERSAKTDSIFQLFQYYSIPTIVWKTAICNINSFMGSNRDSQSHLFEQSLLGTKTITWRFFAQHHVIQEPLTNQSGINTLNMVM